MKNKILAFVIVSLMLCVSSNAAELGRSKPRVVDNIPDTRGRVSDNKATGLQFSLFEPAQVFPRSWDVYGMRVNLLYGHNQNLRGFDCGVVNAADGLMEGFQLGAANWVKELSGVQIGAYNSISESVGGSFQLGALNNAVDFMGLQLGAINYSKQVNGSQIGVINICETINGVQIGLINIISRSDFLVFCPLFNAQF